MIEQLQDRFSRAFLEGPWKHTDPRARERLAFFVGELMRFNPATNLISRRAPALRAAELVEECCLAAAGLSAIAGPWLDLGSGGGFPGIVFACLYPDREIRLVERRQSRADFLERCLRQLELDQARVEATDLRRIVPDADCRLGTAKAVAPAPKVIRWLEPHVAPAGAILLFGRPGWTPEVEGVRGWVVQSSWSTGPERAAFLLSRSA